MDPWLCGMQQHVIYLTIFSSRQMCSTLFFWWFASHDSGDDGDVGNVSVVVVILSFLSFPKTYFLACWNPQSHTHTHVWAHPAFDSNIRCDTHWVSIWVARIRICKMRWAPYFVLIRTITYSSSSSSSSYSNMGCGIGKNYICGITNLWAFEEKVLHYYFFSENNLRKKVITENGNVSGLTQIQFKNGLQVDTRDVLYNHITNGSICCQP